MGINLSTVTLPVIADPTPNGPTRAVPKDELNKVRLPLVAKVPRFKSKSVFIFKIPCRSTVVGLLMIIVFIMLLATSPAGTI